MRTRLGFISGFTAGYYLGSMAGHERYEQLNRLARKVRRSNAYDAATDKAKAAAFVAAEKAKDGAEKAKDAVSDKIHHNGTNGSDNSFTAS